MTNGQIMAVRQHLEEETMTTLDRPKVKEFHQAVNAALTKVAQEQGFTYRPGGFRYDSFSCGGKINFVLQGSEQKLAELTGAFAVNGIKVGDTVTVSDKSERYRVESFTLQGGSHITRLRDNKPFRCKQAWLKKVTS